MYKKSQLENGIRVISCQMPRMQSCAVGVWIKVGGRYEPSRTKGISHYMEHLAFKGSRLYSCRQIKESIEGVGGALNGFTSEEVTCYLAKLPSRHFTLALEVLSDMVLNPLLLESEVEKERTVILEEIKMYKDLPQSFVHELLDSLLWPGQPLGESIAGSEDTVKGISRNDLLDFQKKYYGAPHLVISASGRFPEDVFKKVIEKKFKGLKPGPAVEFLPAKLSQVKPQLKLLHKETEQTHLALGFHSMDRSHPLRHAVGLLHIIMGANMSSRLFNEIREKRGLAYEIGTQVKRFYDTGAFIVHAGIDNRKVTEAIRLILQELNKVKATLVTPDEFKRAKEFYIGQLLLALEDTLDRMLWIGELTATLNRTYTLEEVVREVEKLKRQDLQEAARCIFKDTNMNLALIGPLGTDDNKLQSLLRLG